MDKLNELIDLDPFEVHISRMFSLEHVDEAHLALNTHYLGRLALHSEIPGMKYLFIRYLQSFQISD